MKKTTLAFLMTFFFTLFYSNTIKADKNPMATIDDYKKFLNTTTCIVLDRNPMSDFNFGIEDAVKNSWTITKYKIITEREFEQLKNDDSYSFIFTSVVNFAKDNTKAKYRFMSLVMGEKTSHLNRLPDLCSIPLSYVKVDEDSYVYKLEGFIKFMQNHVRLALEKPEIIDKNMYKYYNKNAQQLSGKTLYVTKEDLSSEVNSLSKIKKYYTRKVEIVSKDEIEDAIERKDPNIVYIHKVGPEKTTTLKARCYIIAVGASNSEFYYFDYHMISAKKPDGLLDSDFKNMNK